MPLLVNTKVRPSSIHGMGLFADQKINKGDVVWEHSSVFDGWLNDYYLAIAPDSLRKHVDNFYCYDNELKSYILACDNINWINHSGDPNLDSPTKYIHYAKREIESGEELTLDYKQICDLEEEEIEFH